MFEKITDTDTILKLTYEIGYTKSLLDMRLRGYLNVLGLYVQLREFGGICRLQAGGKHRACFDAKGSLPSSGLSYSLGDIRWSSKNFDARTWEDRFAHLLGPTFEIAHELNGFAYLPPSNRTRLVTQALHRAEQTGQWAGVLQCTCSNCQIAVPYWKHHVERGRCPQCGGTLNVSEYIPAQSGQREHPQAQSRQLQGQRTWQCLGCEKNNAFTERFCTSCGNPRPGPPPAPYLTRG